MLGRERAQKPAAAQGPAVAQSQAGMTLLTVVGAGVATGNVEITETGRVNGNIETDSLVISKGGFFNGHVVKSKVDEAAKPRPIHVVEGTRAGAQR